ncbi:putative reverse transcriptase domain-containing protein [Tanacetum coccineum]
MTRSLTTKLFTPYKEPEREFRSSRRHFKTLSLDELRSPDFNLFSDQEYSEEEEAETMAETMEHGSDHEDANEHIEKVLEIVDLFHIPNITIDQVMLRAFPMSLTGIARRWLRNEPTGSITIWDGLKTKFLNKYCPPAQTAKKMEEINNFQQEPDENPYQAWERFKELLMKCPQHYLTEMQEVILFYNGLGIPTRQILNSRGAIPSKTVADAKERGFGSLPSSTEVNPRDQVKSISTTIKVDSCLIRHIGSSQYDVSTGKNRASVSVMPLSTYLNLGLGELAHTKLIVELADMSVKYPKGIAENMLVSIGKFTFPLDFIILDMPEDIKVSLILGRPFLSTSHAKIDVYKRKITLRVGEERIIFTSVKPANSLIKRVYMLSLRERMELDLGVRLMGETLVLNRSLDPFFEDYIELNDLNEPFELRRNQGDDLIPTIEEGEVIKEFRTRDEELDAGIDDYPCYCDYDKKIHIDCARNLKFSCMIGFEFTHANFFLLLYVNVISKKFHNSIIKDKMVYKGNNVIGALMNVPIFVGTFSVVMDFAVLENMDDYRDEGMGDVIFGEPFLREVGIKTRRFEGMITIYNGNDEETYQMVRSHPRFKYHTNEQCNKIPPLLKVSEEDKMNGISHPYKKLKGFYKRILNLGSDYIRDAKMEEWLTRGHISVHEME